jgi:hypothetical protein
MATRTRSRTRHGAPRMPGARRRSLSSALLGLAISVLAAGSLLAGVAGAAPSQTPDPSGTTTTTPATTPPTKPATVPVPARPAPAPETPSVPETKADPETEPEVDPGTKPEARITPVIECSFVDEKTKLTSTVWGYLNRGPDVTVPVGEQNSFDNPKAAKGDPEGDVGQPTEFKEGRNENVFIITAEGDSTWTLTGEQATTPGTACKTNPVPVVSTGLGGLVALAVVTCVMSLVLFWRMRRPPS